MSTKGNKSRFLRGFGTGWFLLVILLIASALNAFGYWIAGEWVARIVLILFLVYIAFKPMNAVYGFIGTKGNIAHFILLIILINIIFGAIYYCGFFRNAGISYDINQPYISYGMFKGAPRDSTIFSNIIPHEIKGMDTEESTTLFISNRTDKNGGIIKDTVIVVSPAKNQAPYYEEEHTFQRIKWITVMQHTALTSLMQEPSELFAAGATYNDIRIAEEQNLNGCDDQMMSRMFSWILVLQVFISWIFFGVFISILYNKFRYES